MPLYRPSELRAFLSSIHKEPLRFSSQRFLIDGNVVAKIVERVNTKNVFEIGSGPGVLTEALLAAGHYVVAIEKDPDFARALSRLSSQSLVVREEDVLHSSLERMCHEYFFSEKTTVVSNLPYHLTTPIVEWLLNYRQYFSHAVLMMQKETAERLVAKKGGCLPLLLSYCGTIQKLFFVSKNSFWPKPAVDSVVVEFKKSDRKLFSREKEQDFFSLGKILFSQKRKTIVHLLREFYEEDEVNKALALAKIPLRARSEDLFLEEMISLFRELPFRFF